MSEEEIKTIKCNDIEIPIEYLSNTNVIIPGNRYIQLQQENRQLKEQNNNYRRLGFKHLQQQNNLYQSVIDEVQHILNNQIDYREFVDVVNAIEEVLDKANIKESK